MLGLLIVDHGSRRTEANAQLAEVAAHLRRLRPQAVVAEAHMELAEPSIAQAAARLIADGARDIVVLPYFLSAGRHSQEDIPRLMGEAMAGHPAIPWRIGPPLGPDPALAELALARAGVAGAAAAPSVVAGIAGMLGRIATGLGALGWGICLIPLLMPGDRLFAELRELGAQGLPAVPLVEYFARMALLVFTGFGLLMAWLAWSWRRQRHLVMAVAAFHLLSAPALIIAARSAHAQAPIIAVDVVFATVVGALMLAGILLDRR